MIVLKDETYVSGSTVMVPNREVDRESNTYEKYKEEQKRIIKKNTNKRLKKKTKVLRNIFFTFVIGITLVWRYSSIYNMQKNLNSLKENIVILNKENENLKVELAKFSNLNTVEENATNKLQMVQPNKSEAMYMDISKEYIKDKSINKQEEKNIKNIIGKIKDWLF